MATDRSDYLRDWYQKNRERLNKKRREKTREKVRKSHQMLKDIVSKTKKSGYWWEEE